jgi:arylsulfatase A-like enzyme
MLVKKRLCCAVGLVVALLGCGEDPERPSSVVLIVIDTVRADHLGTYGYGRPTSPFLGRWAEQGVLFERAQASSPWTVPSFGSIYTGHDPGRHGAGFLLKRGANEFAPMDAEVPSLAQVLERAGYATAAIVNNDLLRPTFGLARGFETYDWTPRRHGKPYRRADEVVAAAIAWLDARDERPFLLVVHLMDPHFAYDPPEEVRGRFMGGGAETFHYDDMDVFELRSRTRATEEAERRLLAAAYDEELLFVDAQIGRLLENLEQRGLLESALVVLTSDHGEEFFEHDGFEHGHSVFQELLHVPLLVWGPGVVPGRISTPELAGLTLWPMLTRREPLPSRALVSEGTLWGPPRKALLRWPWKAIKNGSRGAQRQLFNLVDDPEERHDLAAAESERLGRMLEELETLAHVDPERQKSWRALKIDEDTRDALKALGYLE